MKHSYISVQTQFVGLHNWSKCPIEEVRFLQYPHRHIFYVTATLPVAHDDRQLEFFMVKEQLDEIIHAKFFMGNNGMYELGSKSCEMIADIIVDELHRLDPKLLWIRVTVSEDNENNAGVMWEKDSCL